MESIQSGQLISFAITSNLKSFIALAHGYNNKPKFLFFSTLLIVDRYRVMMNAAK